MAHGYFAFLRAVNVGGRVVKMADLRRWLEAAGLAGVETFIASGNVVFESGRRDARAIERAVERTLVDALGYEVTTFVRTRGELAAIAASHPFRDDSLAGEGTVYVSFLKEEPPAAVRRSVLALATATDRFDVRGRELYWLCGTRLSESKVTGAALERALGGPATQRNMTTVQRLAAKYPPAPR